MPSLDKNSIAILGLAGAGVLYVLKQHPALADSFSATAAILTFGALLLHRRRS